MSSANSARCVCLPVFLIVLDMAHLLGNQLCIESLQKDVGDLQAVVVDIFSRTGAVSFPSWKYPDKSSSDLDVNELLERFCYSSDAEDCQVSHVILLELVVDRFVLVMQSFSKYLERMLLIGQSSGGTSAVSNASVGLVVKKYWNKMIQLHSLVQHLKKENCSQSRKISELNEIIEAAVKPEPVNVSSDVTSYDHSMPEGQRRAPRRTPIFSPIAADYNCKSTQTYETAFIPCESCDNVQQSLRKVGDSFAELFAAQNLSSAAQRVSARLGQRWLSAQETRSLAQEQEKDLRCLQAHVEKLDSTVKSLTKQLEDGRKSYSDIEVRFMKCNKDLTEAKENNRVLCKQNAKKLQDCRDKHKKEVSELNRKTGELQQEKQTLEVNVADLKCELDAQSAALRNLETSQAKLLDDLQVNKVSHQEVKRSQKYVDILEKEIKELNKNMEDSSRVIAREEARNHSVSKHLESMKEKQSGLLDQIERVELENEDLKREVAEFESCRESLSKSLEDTMNTCMLLKENDKRQIGKIDELSAQNVQLENSCRSLRERLGDLELQVQGAKEQERLLIEYPDLNGPINTDFEGTGDVVQDMQNQIRANAVRIDILQEENEHLRGSVQKMLKTKNRNVVHGKQDNTVRPDGDTRSVNPSSVPPLQLWRQ